MAGDFIRWEKGLCRKPEVIQMARKLGISIPETAARCMMFWEYADEATTTGDLPGVTEDVIDEIAGIQGLAKAMSETVPNPWLDLSETGAFITNYERHNGKCAKKRAQDADRKYRSRLRTVA